MKTFDVTSIHGIVISSGDGLLFEVCSGVCVCEYVCVCFYVSTGMFLVSLHMWCVSACSCTTFSVVWSLWYIVYFRFLSMLVGCCLATKVVMALYTWVA